MFIQKLRVDSSDSVTDLCELGIKYGTDKSPYNTNNSLHKHAYTAIYNLLFLSLRYKEINIAEIGILDNMSMLCWREFFPKAKLYGFEYFDNKLVKAINDKLENTTYHKLDITNEDSIKNNFKKINIKYDIIIEDSTHIFEDQIRFINNTYQYLNEGGIMIIEDIFINADENLYQQALFGVSEYFSSATFIFADHNLKASPGWNNDKLLVLQRNNKKCI